MKSIADVLVKLTVFFHPGRQRRKPVGLSVAMPPHLVSDVSRSLTVFAALTACACSTTAGLGPGGNGEGGQNGGLEPVGSKVQGVMGCPTVDLPAYAASSSLGTLSQVFQDGCVSCHGGQGRGLGSVPGIPGGLSLEDYRQVVRDGRRGMPSFSESEYGEDDLAADFAVLRGAAPVDAGVGDGQTAAPRWSDEEIEDRLRAGLEVWRKPDGSGAACANCHSPDGIELSVIGYSNADITRRALLHLSPTDASVLVDMVHARRQKLGLAKVCDPFAWRPLQPGGEPLVGTGFWETEAAFLKQFFDRDLAATKGVVDSYEAAVRVRDDWLALDTRRIKTRVEFSRFSEDRFHGPDHSSLNDWVTAVPRLPMPGQDSAWFAEHDKYLQDPSDRSFLSLYAKLGAMTRMDESLENSPSSFIFEGKYESVLLLSHLMRAELTGGVGYLDRPPRLFEPYEVEPGYEGESGDYSSYDGGVPNPFWYVGYYSNGASVPHCNGNFGGEIENCQRLPDDAFAEALPGQLSTEMTHALGESWMMMGWYWDPGMMPSQGDNYNQYRGKYWELSGYAEAFFISHMRLMYQVLLDGTGFAGSHLGVTDVLPILHGEYLFPSHMPGYLSSEEVEQEGADDFVALYRPLALNTYRMWAYLLDHELSAGQPVAAKDVLLEHLAMFRQFCADAGDDEAVALFESVEAKVQSATEVSQ